MPCSLKSENQLENGNLYLCKNFVGFHGDKSVVIPCSVMEKIRVDQSGTTLQIYDGEREFAFTEFVFESEVERQKTLKQMIDTIHWNQQNTEAFPEFQTPESCLSVENWKLLKCLGTRTEVPKGTKIEPNHKVFYVILKGKISLMVS